MDMINTIIMVLVMLFWLFVILYIIALANEDDKARKRAIWHNVLTEHSAKGNKWAEEMLDKHGDKLVK